MPDLDEFRVVTLHRNARPYLVHNECEARVYAIDHNDAMDELVWTAEHHVCHLRDPLPCGCRPHITRMTGMGFHCETEDQGYCNFECPHYDEED